MLEQVGARGPLAIVISHLLKSGVSVRQQNPSREKSKNIDTFDDNFLRCLTNPEDHEICSEDECPFGSGHYDLIPDTDDESIIYDYFPGLIF